MDSNLNIMRNTNAFHPKSFIDLILRKNFYQIYFVVHGQDVKKVKGAEDICHCTCHIKVTNNVHSHTTTTRSRYIPPRQRETRLQSSKLTQTWNLKQNTHEYKRQMYDKLKRTCLHRLSNV